MKPDPEPEGRLKVLMVEDSEEDSVLVAEALRRGGFDPEYRRVEDAEGMREALAEGGWQVILADHTLPGFSAGAAFTIYREARLDIPFLIVSGTISTEVAVTAMHSGVHDFLVKGRLDRLAPAVQRELLAAATRRENARVDHELHSAYAELSAIYADCPVALLVVGRDLRIQRANSLAAGLAGHRPEEMKGRRLDEVFPDSSVCQAATAVANSGSPRNGIEELVHLSRDGPREDRWLLVTCSPIDSDGRQSVLVCGKDITELRRAHLDLERQNETLALQAHLINLSHDAVILADSARVIAGWNQGAEEIYGYSAEEAVGATIPRLLQTNGSVPLEAIDRMLHQTGRWEGELSHIRHDGQTIISDSRQVLLRDSGGRVTGMLEINRDITQRRQDEDMLHRTVHALEAALAEKTVLFQEIHHRVKNNLAIIASMLNLKAQATGNTDTRAALEESRDRVHSMALIHEHLYSSPHLDRVDFADYARRLAEELQQALVEDPDRVAIRLALEPIELGIERAVPCAVILNELVSNACKYAFPDARRGEIRISFRKSAAGMLELAVEDDGCGMPPGVLGNGEISSLGLRIVHILAKQLDAALVQEPCAGTRIVLRFPAAAAASPEHQEATECPA